MKDKQTEALKQFNDEQAKIIAEYIEKAVKEKEDEMHDKLHKVMAELWDNGMNMGGEYQGVWVRFKVIEKTMEKYFGRRKV